MAMMLLLWDTVALRAIVVVLIVVMVGGGLAVTKIEVDFVIVIVISTVSLVHIRVLAILIVVLLVGLLCGIVVIVSGRLLRSSGLVGSCLGLGSWFVVVIAGMLLARNRGHGCEDNLQISEQVILEVLWFRHDGA